MPDMENEITFALTGTDGQTEEQTITYEMGSLMGQEEVQLETEEGNSVEDVVVRLNVTDGTVDEVLDLGDLFGAYKETCVENSDGDLDWMHINTIQWMGDGQVLLSSRETSSVIKIADLYGAPAVEYI